MHINRGQYFHLPRFYSQTPLDLSIWDNLLYIIILNYKLSLKYKLIIFKNLFNIKLQNFENLLF